MQTCIMSEYQKEEKKKRSGIWTFPRTISEKTSQYVITRHIASPNKRFSLLPASGLHEGGPQIHYWDIERCTDFARSHCIRLGEAGGSAWEWGVLCSIEGLQLMFIYGRWADQNESRVLCACRRVQNDCLQVLFILIQGHMLIMGWNACIIGTEENSLSDVS